MDLEWALYELTKQPQSVICKDGHAHPAIRYTKRTQEALDWLVARYNDGTLKVEGYVPKRTPHCKRPPKRIKDEIHNGEYMFLSAFMRLSGFTYDEVRRISRAADAYVPPIKHGSHSFINVNKFYDYLNKQSRKIHDNTKINLTQACEMSGLDKKTMKTLIANNTIKANVRRNPSGSTNYDIFQYSVLKYMEKGAKNGKDDTINGEVCGE